MRRAHHSVCVKDGGHVAPLLCPPYDSNSIFKQQRTRLRIPAARNCPDLASSVPLVKTQRAQGMPDAGRTREPCVQRKCTYARKQQQGSRNNRHSLRDGLRLIRDLLGVPGLLASVACRSPARLIPASGDRDHTISPSALAPLALRHQHVHRIPDPTSVAMRGRPSERIRMREDKHSFLKNGREILS